MIFQHIVPPKELNDDEVNILKANMSQLQRKHNRNVLRTNYYNIKKLLDKIGFSVPPEMRELDAVLGWPAKAVDGLAGRIHLEGFVDAGKAAQDELEEQLTLNNMAMEWSQLWVSTLIHGISFVAVTPGDTDDDEPDALIQCMPATEATGIWDVRRRQLTSAVWCPKPEVESLGGITQPQIAVLFTKDNIITLERDTFAGPWQVDKVKNPLPRLPVVPVRHKPQLARPYGNSRMTNAVMYLTQLAMRTMLRTEVSAEFYSSPQRWAMGVDPEAFVDTETGQKISPWETILGRIWTIGRDDDGELPQVGQFAQQTMQPHIEQLRAIATMFAAETSLPLNSLGIVQDNPASAEAIEAAWTDMVGLAEQAHTELGVPAVQIAQNVMMTLNRGTKLNKYLKLSTLWRDASTPTRAAMADAVTKLVTAGVLQPDSKVGLEKLGFTQTDIERIVAEHKKAKEDDPQSKLMNALNGQDQQALPPGQPVPAGPQPVPAAPAAQPPAKKAVAKRVSSNGGANAA